MLPTITWILFCSFVPFSFSAGVISSSRLWLHRPIQVDAESERSQRCVNWSLSITRFAFQ